MYNVPRSAVIAVFSLPRAIALRRRRSLGKCWFVQQFSHPSSPSEERARTEEESVQRASKDGEPASLENEGISTLTEKATLYWAGRILFCFRANRVLFADLVFFEIFARSSDARV